MRLFFYLYILILLFVPFFQPGNGLAGAQTNYYISSSGNDINDGLTKNTPWKELNRGRNVTFNPGDSVLIRRGDIFEGAIADVFQGSPSQPIVIGSYGEGNLPILYGDLRGRTWTAIPGRIGYYKAYLGGYGTILTGFWQWVNGAWKRSATEGYNGYRGSNSSSWESWLDQLIEGSVGTNIEHDTLFVHTYNNVAFPGRDSMRVYRYGNDIQTGSHDVIIRDLDVRNYYIPIVVTGSKNVTTRKVNMRNGYSSCIRYITDTFGLIDSCVIDSSGDSGIYLVGSHKCIVRNNTVKNVLLTLDGGISAGVDLCGIGILDNYSSGRTQDTVGYNTVEYNNFDNILRAFTDWYYCIGDTVRYNTGHAGSAAGSPMGQNLVFAHNNFTMRSSTGGNGSNIGVLGNGNITYEYNTLDSIGHGYGIWVSENASGGTVSINHNTIKGVTNCFVNFQNKPGITSTYNDFYGSGYFSNDSDIHNSVHTHGLIDFQDLTGYEYGSTLNGVGRNDPYIIISSGSHDFGNIQVNDTSSEWTYTLSGSNLNPAAGNISIAAPIGFEVSKTTATGFSSAITIDYTGEALSSAKVFVRFIPTAAKLYSGYISNSGGNATTRNIFISGDSRSLGEAQLKHSLKPPYPNPSNGRTIIEFFLQNDGYATLKIFDALGREIETLAKGMYSRGIHLFPWDIGDFSSGVYYCKFTSGSYIQTQRIIVLR